MNSLNTPLPPLYKSAAVNSPLVKPLAIQKAQSALKKLSKNISQAHFSPLSPQRNRKKPKTTESDFFVNLPELEPNEKAWRESIRDHASTRIQLFATSALTLYCAGIKSDQSSRKVLIGIGAAELQIGTGSLSHPACHMNAAAGYMDNFRSVFIEETTQASNISPEKMKWLHAKGFTQADLQFLHKHEFSKESISCIFNYRWPEKQQQSILSELPINRILQATTILNREVNLICDKKLEGVIRKSLIDIYYQLIHGKITPKQATEQVVEEAKKCLASMVENFSNIADGLESYLTELQELQNNSADSELQKNVYQRYKQLKKLGMKSKPNHRNFIRTIKRAIINPTLIPEVMNESQARLKRAQQSKLYAQDELEGTSYVNFEHVCGEEFDLNGKEFTQATYVRLRDRLLSMENLNAPQHLDLTEEGYESLLQAHIQRSNRSSRLRKLNF